MATDIFEGFSQEGMLQLDLHRQEEKDVLKGREWWEPDPPGGVYGVCLGVVWSCVVFFLMFY